MRSAAVQPVNPPTAFDRAALIVRGRRLEYFTLAWNGFEAAVALVSGLLAGSVAPIFTTEHTKSTEKRNSFTTEAQRHRGRQALKSDLEVTARASAAFPPRLSLCLCVSVVN